MAYSTITKPGLYFNTKLYTGNGTTDHSITGVGFQPDWTWLKKRNNADDHILQDAVRTATKYIISNSNAAEATYAEGFKSFDSDGFTLGNANNTNQNTHTFVAWNWKANGAGSSNSSGSITSTVSVNTTAGFSIVKYTGTGGTETVGHGLGVTPKMIMVKNLDSSENWGVWHTAIAANKYLGLNQTNAVATNTAIWNNTLPTNAVFSIGNNARTGGSDNYVAYCFANVKGYSRFDSYIGNGNANGSFIYTGFKPIFVMIKKTNATSSWTMWDNKRSSNENNIPLYANLNNAESAQTTVKLDLLSNGFKIRGNGSNVNTSGSTYVYMAFAEEPLVANVGQSIPATAQ
ncbi:hypothetical protein [Hyphomonas sp.]|uniref:DUF7483 domain-containing protein n=1 Tax=Hyphomonas sp. TaxID=87 RepID=UPI0025C5C79A|nr:hypothetical protein [Hyphomonas sp.]